MKTKEIKALCECGCDVRGLTRYQLSGYRKNFDKKTINQTDIVDKHLNNNEHLIHFDLGYVDQDIAIQKAENQMATFYFFSTFVRKV